MKKLSNRSPSKTWIVTILIPINGKDHQFEIEGRTRRNMDRKLDNQLSIYALTRKQVSIKEKIGSDKIYNIQPRIIQGSEDSGSNS